MIAPNPYAPPRADLDAPTVSDADLPLAGRGARLGAQLLDLLLLAVPLFAMSVGAFLEVNAHSVGARQPTSSGIPALWAGGLGAAALLLFQIYRVARRGQSLGKQWLGLRIVGVDGSRATFVRTVLLRTLLPWLLAWIPFVGWFVLPIDWLVIFREDRRCLHDLIAGTKVVVVRAL
jgi:uncharacterized RDD family membrane protein YckC